MRITCAIIDDEPLAAALLESYAQKVSYLEPCGTFNSAITAMRQLREKPVDLIFLDIQMPELSGLEFAKILPARTKVIFTTAFSQYAIDGYKVNAIGYMLKPIAFEEFQSLAALFRGRVFVGCLNCGITHSTRRFSLPKERLQADSRQSGRRFLYRRSKRLCKSVFRQWHAAYYVADEYEKTGRTPAQARVHAHSPFLHCAHDKGEYG